MRKSQQARFKIASARKDNKKGNRGDRVSPQMSDSKKKLFSTIECEPEFGETAFLKRYTDIIEKS
ncbi:hypothetical protein [Limnobacter sp. UBA6514]|uniref:hypothetical protein n=1 Tax=Limnobacter sp. UBA6514 TaxID=1946761 RepID=UPI0025B9CE07|nr:hypothetical protein [Limnobacter sp. UBA6514]|tara:strand:+ start:162 stop:356 length:195 start_codon:yes stop_codon:yes gene_type:complete